MKLKSEFIAHDTESETVLVGTGDSGFTGIVRGNATLGAILDILSADVTEEQIVAEMKKRYDAPDGAIERDVARALSELRRIGAIDG